MKNRKYIRLVDNNMSHALSQWVMAVLLDFLRDGSFYRQNREKREFNKLPNVVLMQSKRPSTALEPLVQLLPIN